jgi:hypothetical protein
VTVLTPLLGPILTSTARTPSHAVTTPSSAKLPSTPAFALLWTFALFRWLSRRLGWSGMASRQIFLIADCHANRTGAPRCWRTSFFVPERPVPCPFCCHPEEHRSGHYRPVRSTPRTCPPFARLSQLVSLSARPLFSKTYTFCAFA